MGKNAEEIINLGCGYGYTVGCINVDAQPECEPDVVWDLNDTPWPFDNESSSKILAHHIFEHLDDYWQALLECIRILKPGGILEVKVPSAEGNSLGSRDHKHIISVESFDGITNLKFRQGKNAWMRHQEEIPLKLIRYQLNVGNNLKWWPGFIKRWAALHLRNICREQIFVFQKVPNAT